MVGTVTMRYRRQEIQSIRLASLAVVEASRSLEARTKQTVVSLIEKEKYTRTLWSNDCLLEACHIAVIFRQ